MFLRWIACLTFINCGAQEGGAAEVSWSLRTFSGVIPSQINMCARSMISGVRLCWQHESEGLENAGFMPCTAEASALFSCQVENGATKFELREGALAFWLEPQCEDGLPPELDTYAVPPPVVRQVLAGQIVTLQSHLIAVTDPTRDCPDTGCTCQR